VAGGLRRHQISALLLFIAGAIFLGLRFVPSQPRAFLPLGIVFLVLGVAQLRRRPSGS
jgi:hypothetical protein